MATAFSTALLCVQQGQDDLQLSSHLNQLAAEFPSPRRRLLPPDRTLSLFVQQVANRNAACAAVRHIAGEAFSDSAWCQARARLPIEMIEKVNERVVESSMNGLDRGTADVAPGNLDVTPRWRGHRVFVLDGTNDSMPDTPALREHYGVPPGTREGLGFPMSHLLMRMDHRSGLILNCIDGPNRRSDLADTPAIHAQLDPGDIVLADRYFSGFTEIALIMQAKAHFVMPVHQQRIVNFIEGREHVDPRKGMDMKDKGKARSRLIKKLGKDDQIVEYVKPRKKPLWLDDERWARIPDTIQVREIRRMFHRKGFKPIEVTIVTSLLDPELYPADELIELRLSRWMIETGFRHLKITLGMDVLKCKTLDGVQKERLIFILVYNLIRALMIRAARAQRVNVHRISFADTLAWVRFADHSGSGKPGLPHMVVNPIRKARLEPRVIKRAKKQFPSMTRPRAELKAQLRAKHGDTA